MAKSFRDDNPEWNINKSYGSIIAEQIDNLKEAARKGAEMEWNNELNVLYMLVSGHGKMQGAKSLRPGMDEIGRNIELIHGGGNLLKEEKDARIKATKRKLFEVSSALIRMMHEAGLWFDLEKKDLKKAVYET